MDVRYFLPKNMRCLFAILTLFLLGCESALDRQHKEALQRLSAINQVQLVTEVESILALPDEKRAFDLPKDMWTPEIIKLHPVAVRCYDEGIAILLKKWVSKESGFYVTPGAQSHSTSEAPIGVRRKISDEIEWYAL